MRPTAVRPSTARSPRSRLITAGSALLLFGAVVLGEGAGAAEGAKAPPDPETFYNRTGFDGRSDELGAAVVDAIRKAGPDNGEGLDFTPDQRRMLGLAVAKAIKTISDDAPYQHEMNDALVKADLTKIQFAKENGLLDKVIEHEVKTQMPMLVRVGKMIREGGSPELAMIALTDRTACFYQLVQEYERTGTSVRWKAPYGNVLSVTRRLGQHDLTPAEIHEIYTIPLMRKQAEVMGMELDISPLGQDGWATMSIRPAS